MIRNRFTVALFTVVALFAFVTCTSCSTVSSSISKSAYETQHPTALRLQMKVEEGIGTCSGTAIAPHVILSATHCFVNEKTGIFNVKEFMVNSQKTKIIKDIISDNSDHSLVLVDATFMSYSGLTSGSNISDDIHFWGNPAGWNDIYRKGYISARDESVTLYDTNGFFGDSGSGIFNSEGKLIAVLSIIVNMTEVRKTDDNSSGIDVSTIKFMGSYPFTFTEDSLKKAGLTGKNPIYSTLIGSLPHKIL